jgi:glucose-6-phosphate 1-epimerase
MSEAPAELNRRLGIPGVAEVASGHGGLTKVAIASPAASGDMYLLGAQVTSWRPAGRDELLFLSRQSRWEPGRAIRGGIPICFPWFGNHAIDPKAPAHGFARTATWRLDTIRQCDAGVEVTTSLESDAQTRLRWPFDFRVLHRAIFGATLHLELIVVNTGTSAFTFEEALHTYYAVGDATAVRVSGLDRVRYLDKVDGGRERVQDGDITIAAETDRVYLDTDAAVDIADPTLRRRIRVEKTASRATVVWNPWTEKARALADLADDEWRRLVCVETANVLPQGITLQPGEQHVMTMTARVGEIS